MGKNKKKHHQRPHTQGSPVPGVHGTPESAAEKASKILGEAVAEAKVEGLDSLPHSSEASPAGDEPFAQAYRQACEARTLFEALKKRVEKKRDELDTRMQALEARENDGAAARNQLKEEQRAAAANAIAQQEREASLVEREEALVKRECDADAGFIARRKDFLRKLEDEVRLLNNQLSQATTRAAEEHAEWAKKAFKAHEEMADELRALRTQHEQQQRDAYDQEQGSLREARAALEDERKALEAKQAEVARAMHRLAIERADLEEHKEELESRAKSKVAGSEERLKLEIGGLTARLEQARAAYQALDEKLQGKEAVEKYFDGVTPEAVLAQLDAVKRERDDLRVQLSTLPTADAILRLQTLENEREHLAAERSQLLHENASLNANLSRYRIAVTELETLRDQKNALESGKALIHAALEELRKDVGERIRRDDERSAFPSCSAMDTAEALQKEQKLKNSLGDAKDFVKDLQQRIALDPSTGKQLFYSLRDLRCFLGGLAMSRLHLLQGMSGTGKTSLPLAFARAIGAGITVVEVQAGWRDRQDLIGHYNSFEKKFYESEFLQALYQAQCPRYQDVPYVVLLDEMNLSHPEQYFADVLSALEQASDRQKLDLMTAPVERAPAKLQSGRTLQIPNNVWFIGTANHDETTKDFADKTYDRAHVMELPRHREAFTPQPASSQLPISLDALTKLFHQAKAKHAAEASRAYQFLEQSFSEPLARRFRVGWGNRLQRQMDAYVPVIIAAGGTVGEAVDHILATKILRKVKDRHDTRPADIQVLREILESNEWKKLGAEAAESQSMAILLQESQRLGEEQE